MRVGLVIYGSLDTISGGYLYDRTLVRHLERQGDTVEIISLPQRAYSRCLAHNLSRALVRRLRECRLDILLQDELNHPSLFWLNRRLRSRGARYPIVSIVHHLRCSEARPDWENRVYRSVEQRYLRSADGFIFNSQTTQKAVEALIFRQRPAVVAYPGGDRLHPAIAPEQVGARAAEPGPLRILFAGNVIPRKGLHTLLAGLSRLPGDVEWRLDVAGSLTADRAYAQAMQAQIARAVLVGRAELLGKISDAAMAKRMARSHVLAVPSSYEGFGIVYLEAMGLGLPGIATSGGGAHEIIAHGENGFLIAPGDADALAACLATLARDRKRLVEMSLAALRRYATHPTWEESAERIRRFLQILAG